MESQQSGGHRDRYNTSGNPEAEYMDEAQLVLRNREGIVDAEQLALREQEVHAAAYEQLLMELTTETRLSCELLKYVHHTIFAPLYEWAGRYRTVWISKPGTTWPAPDFLDANMSVYEKDVLQKYSPDALGDEQSLTKAIAEIQGEFLVIHPFREGNARTIKLATDLFAVQAGRLPLKYDQTEAGAEQYIEAAKAAFKRDYAPLEAIIRTALQAQ